MALTLQQGLAAELPAEYFINRGTVTNAQVNARNFVNEGRFLVDTLTVPWDPQNTINFTNRGTIAGQVGFRFETVDPGFGFRRQASNFFNAPNATIAALDGGGIFSLIGDATGTFFQPNASFLTINAQNLTNRGDLSVGASGLMKLQGEQVDLSGGTLIVEDVGASIFGGFGFGDISMSDTNFIPSAGVYDLAYGIDVNTNMPIGGIVVSVNPNGIQTPIFRITNSAGGIIGSFDCQTFIELTNAKVFVRDARLDLSNRVVQVVAVDTTDTNIGVYGTFFPFVFPGGGPQGGYLSPVVEFRVASTNFRTLDLQTNSLYYLDQLGSQTNYSLVQNLADNTLKPASSIIFRGSPGLGELGAPGLPFLNPDIFDDPSYSNRIVTSQYAAYSAQIESRASRVPPLPDLGVTNLPGRVEIKASDLRLNNTRMRGEGLISIQAENMTGGQNTVLDVPNLNINFSTKGNLLRLREMTPDQVERLGGFMQVFSGIWTNSYAEVQGTNTNTVEIRFQLVAIDATQLRTTEPVVAHELKLSAPAPGGQVVYEENLSVTNFLEIKATGLTLAEESRLYLGKGVGLSYTNLVNVSSVTNLGHLQANELVELRKGEASGFENFVNRGSIIAFGTDIMAEYFENTGDIISSNFFNSTTSGGFFNSDCFGRPFSQLVDSATEGPININAVTARIDDGRFETLGDIRFSGSVFKINNHRAFAGGSMVFDVSDILTDSGEDSANVWEVRNGFRMAPLRPAGDLLATEIRSSAARLSFVDHIWSAEDRGAVPEGFVDNVALGRLKLEGQELSVFQFLPARPGSAIYLDVLEIDGFQARNFREFTNRVQLSMNVYFGNVESTNVNFTAETINGILGEGAAFNFYWVTNWAGPNSSVDVPLTENGPVRRFNRALRDSLNVDSDGDGLPNRFDPFPFPPEDFEIAGITVAADFKAVTFGFNTTETGTYVIEYATQLGAGAGNWKPLGQVVQANAKGGLMSYTDQAPAGSPQRYYRVRKAKAP